jgi:Phage integrase family
MIRLDLEAADIPDAVETADGPRHADFHALRHSYLTLLGRGVVDLRTAQELAGHSTPVLTARYSHRGLNDLAVAVGRLPSLMPAAGTDGSSLDDGEPACTQLARTAALPGQLEAHAVTTQGEEGEGLETKQPPGSQGVEHHQSLAVSSGHQRGRRDSNPQPPDRQSGTLTN